MLLTELVLTSQAVAATPRRGVKIGEIAGLLRPASPEEVPVVVAFLSGELRQRQIGVGYAALGGLLSDDGAAEMTPALTVGEVDSVFAEVGAVTGAGAQVARKRLLAGLFDRATAGERDFLIRLIAGELHQGALEGVMIEAVARAAGVPADEVRRAHLLGGSLQAVAAAAMLLADEASMSRSGRPTCRPNERSAADAALAAGVGTAGVVTAPGSGAASAAAATACSDPPSRCARLTSSAGTPAARATASIITPSSAP